MGANVSTNIQKVKQSISTDISTECENQANVSQTMKGLKVTISGSNCGDITFANNAVVAQTCDLSAMAKTMAETVQGSTSKQLQAMSLGGNVNTSVQDRTNEIKTKLETKCGSAANIEQTISDVEFKVEPWCYPPSNIFGKPTCFPAECGDVTFLNSASATQQCVAKVISDAQDKLTQTAVNDQTTQTIGIGIGGAIFLVVIVGGFAAYKMSKKKGGQGGDASGAAAAIAAAKGGPTKGNARADAVSGLMSGAFGAAKQALAAKGIKGGGRSKGVKGGKGSKGRKLVDGIPLIVLVIVGLVLYSRYRDEQQRLLRR